MKAKKMPIALMGLLSIALVVLKTPSRADGPRLGAEVYSIVVVSQVMPDSAAARAGLQKGDIIFGINGHHTRSAIGSNSLAFGISVEISMTLLLK